MNDITEFIKGVFNDWLIDHIRGIVIGCLVIGAVWFGGHWALDYYVSIYNVIRAVSNILDVVGIASLCLFIVAVVNYGVHWINKLLKSH